MSEEGAPEGPDWSGVPDSRLGSFVKRVIESRGVGHHGPTPTCPPVREHRRRVRRVPYQRLSPCPSPRVPQPVDTTREDTYH